MVMRYYPVQQPNAWCSSSAPSSTPKWGWLYVLLPLLMVLFLLERRQPLSRAGHIAAQSAIVLVIYGLMALWLQVNQGALRTENRTEKPRIVYIIYTSTQDAATSRNTALSSSDLIGVYTQQDRTLALAFVPLAASVDENPQPVNSGCELDQTKGSIYYDCTT